MAEWRNKSYAPTKSIWAIRVASTCDPAAIASSPLVLRKKSCERRAAADATCLEGAEHALAPQVDAGRQHCHKAQKLKESRGQDAYRNVTSNSPHTSSDGMERVYGGICWRSPKAFDGVGVQRPFTARDTHATRNERGLLCNARNRCPAREARWKRCTRHCTLGARVNGSSGHRTLPQEGRVKTARGALHNRGLGMARHIH